MKPDDGASGGSLRDCSRCGRWSPRRAPRGVRQSGGGLRNCDWRGRWRTRRAPRGVGLSPGGPPVGGLRESMGFTLAEMLVAMTGAALLGSVLVVLLFRQSRFHLRTDDTVQAAQTTRGLIDGMGAEIRGAGPADLLVATHDSVALRVDILRAVVCRTLSSGRADIFVYDSVPATNVPRLWRGTAYAAPFQARFAYADAFTPTSSRSVAARTACRASGADRSRSASLKWFRRTSGWAGSFGVVPPRGSVVRVFGRLVYSIPAAGGSTTASIRRNAQEFASPLAAGARFEYRMAGGTTLTDVPSASLGQVRAVRLIAETVGRAAAGASRQIVYSMPLRN